MQVIGFRRAAFTWSANVNMPDDSARQFCLRIDQELFFVQGGINLIVGPTGSGKTSLLMALLGEMHFLPSGPDSAFWLPREGGVAYAAQESWVLNDTIKVCQVKYCVARIVVTHDRETFSSDLPSMRSDIKKVGKSR